jgi:hypothetical protein
MADVGGGEDAHWPPGVFTNLPRPGSLGFAGRDAKHFELRACRWIRIHKGWRKLFHLHSGLCTSCLFVPSFLVLIVLCSTSPADNLPSVKMVNVPAFVHTPVEKIAVIHDRVTKSFLAHKTRSLEWRLTQLRKLYWG